LEIPKNFDPKAKSMDEWFEQVRGDFPLGGSMFSVSSLEVEEGEGEEERERKRKRKERERKRKRKERKRKRERRRRRRRRRSQRDHPVFHVSRCRGARARRQVFVPLL
jgi:hypothetical protein